MLMLCWFYCIPFAKLLYFALAPLLFVFGLFALKRGIYRQRAGLRLASFLLMFVSALKFFVFDIRLLKTDLLCAGGLGWAPQLCQRGVMILIDLAGLIAMCLVSFVIFHFYRRTLPNSKPPRLRPEDVNLRSWANASLLTVCAMIVWTLAPWVSSLLIGSVPALFSILQWQHFAIINVILLVIGFWKVESCDWTITAADGRVRRIDSAQAAASWTPRDTLWMNVFLFLVTLALSYVAHDILT
jgi:hypothetical protein